MSEPNSQSFPAPDAAALAHSVGLVRVIRDLIDAAGGWIDFADYMDAALYAPGLGYYSAGAQKFGAAGDFVTAPEISPLFAACLARVCANTFAGSAATQSILELGAGTGALAAGVLATLERLDAVPAQYRILEVSADLRDRQRALLTAELPGLVDRVTWLDELPAAPLDGVVLANEVLDALPVSRFRIGEDHRPAMLGVVADGDGFALRPGPASDEQCAHIRQLEIEAGADWPAGYVSEYAPGLAALVGGLAAHLGHGLMLLIDYGLARREYYAPERDSGTLRCHYRHRAHDDPFVYPGLQDITAWVDFTAVARAASAAGLDVLGFTTQARFLLAGGVEQALGDLARDADEATARRRRLEYSRQLQTLMMPGQMGETFKVLTLGRALQDSPIAFGDHDLLYRL